MTARFSCEVKSVTISRNGRSRSTEITGHDRPEWAVTMGRNTQYPDRWERMHLAGLMKGRADCQVSNRWLQFPEAANENPKGAGKHALMIVNVMTGNAEDKGRKICELILAREDLLAILDRMPVVPRGGSLLPKLGPLDE